MKQRQSRAADRQPVRSTFDVLGLARQARDAVSSEMAAPEIRWRLDVPDRLTFQADVEMLADALRQLVANAVEAMPRGGELVITAVRTARGLELEVADSGPGVEVERRGLIFQPYFTTKPSGRGLGLVKVRRIAERHGGHVTVLNCPEGGAAFTIFLPGRAMEAAA